MFSTTPNFRSTCIHRRVWVIWLWRCDLTLPVVSLTVACLMDRSRHSGEKAGAGSHCSCTLGPIMVSPPYLLSCGQHGRSSHSAKSVGKVSDGLSLFTLPILLHCIFSVRLYCWAHTGVQNTTADALSWDNIILFHLYSPDYPSSRSCFSPGAAPHSPL